MAYDNTNSGTLGKNRNPKSDRSPTYTGKIDLCGTMFWISGWIRSDFETNENFFSLLLNDQQVDDNKGNGKLTKDKFQRGRSPDYKGSVEIDMGIFEIVAWTRQSNDGNSFLSIKATLETVKGEFKDDMNANRPADIEQPRPANAHVDHQKMGNSKPNDPTMDFDDDIPF